MLGQRNADEQTGRTKHFSGFAARPGTFPSAPQRNVTEVQLIPPQIQHVLVEAQNAVASDSRGRRNERRKTIVNAAAVRLVHAHKQVPKRERVTWPGFLQYYVELRIPFLLAARAKVEPGERLAKR
jgi:hypothetical protein